MQRINPWTFEVHSMCSASDLSFFLLVVHCFFLLCFQGSSARWRNTIPLLRSTLDICIKQCMFFSTEKEDLCPFHKPGERNFHFILLPWIFIWSIPSGFLIWLPAITCLNWQVSLSLLLREKSWWNVSFLAPFRICIYLEFSQDKDPSCNLFTGYK